MSSTRDSLSGLREDSMIIASLKNQVKENQDMAQDFQMMASMNREAIALFADTSVHARDKIVANLRSENTLLFRALTRCLANNRRLETTVDYDSSGRRAP